MNHLNVYKLTPEYVLSACECMCAVCVVYEWVDRGIPLVVRYFCSVSIYATYTTGALNVARAHAPHCDAAESDFGLCPSPSMQHHQYEGKV